MMEVTGVFFEWGNAPLSWLIRLASGGPNHVGTILDDGLTIEATPSRGVHRREPPKGALVVDMTQRSQEYRRAIWAACLGAHLRAKAPYDYAAVIWVTLTLLFPWLKKRRTVLGRNNAYYCAECVNSCLHIVRLPPEATTPRDIARALGVTRGAW